MILEYAKSFIGVPYRWGGESPILGFDCSGFAQECLKSIGMDPPGDQTAKALKEELLKAGGTVIQNHKAGAFVFYGSTPDRISHVDICLSKHQVIGAQGGGATTHTMELAHEQRAFIRVRHTGYRLDLQGIVMPKYPEWVWDTL